jgi:hypothetical protein
VITALFALSLLDACGGDTQKAGARSGHDASGPTVARRRLEDRPPLVLVRRDGDPFAAVAFAVATDQGSLPSVATATLLRARLAAKGFNVRAQPSGVGLSLTVLVPNAMEGRRFVQVVGTALEQPVTAGEPGLEAVRAAVQTLSAARAPGPAEAAVNACSGEPVLPETSKSWDPASEKGRGDLAGWLEAAHSLRRAAFAAVGAADVLAAVEDALARASDWPNGDSLEDPWPARDELGVDFSAGATRRLSLALRLPSEDVAARAARALAAPQATLSRRLASLRPAWQLDRSAAIGRFRGACLRVDAVPVHAELGPSATEVARALGIVAEEARDAVLHSARGDLDEAIVGATDPAEAAAAAAWRALVGHGEPGAQRSAVAYVTLPAERPRFDLTAAIIAERQADKEPLFEVVRRAEPGQGRLWALFAPTCGTSVESALTAGEAALIVSALSRVAPNGDVTVEPWLAPDGIGLLAGTRRREPGESSHAQAERLGRALGELIATARPSPTELATARAELASGLGGELHRGYFVTLDALTDGHPSWLEPRGTFASLASAPAGGYEAALGRWLGRPFRLAVLANGDATQSEVVRRELEHWLRPGRGDVARCPSRSHPSAQSSELTLAVSGDAPEGSYVGIPFPAFERRLPVEARATLVLLNRSGGFLDQALSELQASATALALGGPDAAALVIEVVAAEGQRQAAVERVRALVERLASGRLAAADIETARRELAQSEATELLDPRRRLIATWRGVARAEPPLDAARLFAWLASLRRSGAVVVNVASRG